MARALVLGGYGLIGSACVRALGDAGYQVTGVGRSASAARGIDPRADWAFHDLSTLPVTELRALLQGVSIVVNAAGALQDGGRDNLEQIHVGLIARLCEAARDLPVRIIQISAAGVAPDASTRFFQTKAAGDAMLAAGAQDWVILRPTLVLASETYGGTALLRAASALPGILPQVLPGAQVQTVHIDDLAAAVVQAASGAIPSGTTADLTETETRPLADLALALRRWLGLPEPRYRPRLPDWLLTPISRLADAFGLLGWRSPLRRSALRALRDGIRGDPAAWVAAGGRPMRSLEQALATRPATRADRLAARTYLALPLAIAILALFWTATGLISLAAPTAAEAILTGRGMDAGAAALIVRAGGLADVILGLLILWRPRAREAALGMVLLSLAYLAGSLIAAPDLWADPLGPMLKVLPGTVLALWVWLLLEER